MLFHQPKNSVSNYNYNTAFYTTEIWENHFHKNPELIYVINGNVSCKVKDTEYNLSSGDFGLCLPYDIHSYTPDAGTLYFVLVFSEDFVYLFSKQMHDKTTDGFIFHPEDAVKNYVLQQLIYNDDLTIYSLKSCLYALCEEYLKCVNVIKKDISHNNIVADVVDYIEKNHTKRFTLSDRAKQFGYDYNYMSRLFKNHFNMPFVDFVNIYRIETQSFGKNR